MITDPSIHPTISKKMFGAKIVPSGIDDDWLFDRVIEDGGYRGYLYEVAGPVPTGVIRIELDVVVGGDAGDRVAIGGNDTGDGSTRKSRIKIHPATLIGQHIELLGTMADSKIAEKIGVSTYMVGKVRRRHGIPAYGTRRGAIAKG